MTRRWISDDDALEAFRAYRETREVAPDEHAVDFDLIRAGYEEYALSTSKAGDASRKSHQNHMNLADQVIVFLRAEYPRLDLDAGDVRTSWASRCSDYTKAYDASTTVSIGDYTKASDHNKLGTNIAWLLTNLQVGHDFHTSTGDGLVDIDAHGPEAVEPTRH